MKLRKLSPIIISLCALIVGASAALATGKTYNALGTKDGNALGITEVPELQGLGGAALLTVVGAVGYSARKVYQKIAGRNRQ